MTPHIPKAHPAGVSGTVNLADTSAGAGAGRRLLQWEAQLGLGQAQGRHVTSGQGMCAVWRNPCSVLHAMLLLAAHAACRSRAGQGAVQQGRAAGGSPALVGPSHPALDATLTAINTAGSGRQAQAMPRLRRCRPQAASNSRRQRALLPAARRLPRRRWRPPCGGAHLGRLRAWRRAAAALAPASWPARCPWRLRLWAALLRLWAWGGTRRGAAAAPGGSRCPRSSR